jgi:hypothetical protein
VGVGLKSDQTDLLSAADGLSRPGAWEAMREIVVGVLLKRALTAAICSSIPRHTPVPGMELPIALPDRTSRCCDLPGLLCHLALGVRSHCATNPGIPHMRKAPPPRYTPSERLVGGSHDRARREEEEEEEESLGGRHITLHSTLVLLPFPGWHLCIAYASAHTTQ